MLLDVLIIICVVSAFCGFFCVGKKLGGFIYGRFFCKPTLKVIVKKLDGTVNEYLLNEEEAKAFIEACHKYKL